MTKHAIILSFLLSILFFSFVVNAQEPHLFTGYIQKNGKELQNATVKLGGYIGYEGKTDKDGKFTITITQRLKDELREKKQLLIIKDDKSNHFYKTTIILRGGALTTVEDIIEFKTSKEELTIKRIFKNKSDYNAALQKKVKILIPKFDPTTFLRPHKETGILAIDIQNLINTCDLDLTRSDNRKIKVYCVLDTSILKVIDIHSDGGGDEIDRAKNEIEIEIDRGGNYATFIIGYTQAHSDQRDWDKPVKNDLGRYGFVRKHYQQFKAICNHKIEFQPYLKGYDYFDWKDIAETNDVGRLNDHRAFNDSTEYNGCTHHRYLLEYLTKPKKNSSKRIYRRRKRFYKKYEEDFTYKKKLYNFPLISLEKDPKLSPEIIRHLMGGKDIIVIVEDEFHKPLGARIDFLNAGINDSTKKESGSLNIPSAGFKQGSTLDYGDMVSVRCIPNDKKYKVSRSFEFILKDGGSDQYVNLREGQGANENKFKLHNNKATCIRFVLSYTQEALDSIDWNKVVDNKDPLELYHLIQSHHKNYKLVCTHRGNFRELLSRYDDEHWDGYAKKSEREFQKHQEFHDNVDIINPSGCIHESSLGAIAVQLTEKSYRKTIKTLTKDEPSQENSLVERLEIHLDFHPDKATDILEEYDEQWYRQALSIQQLIAHKDTIDKLGKHVTPVYVSKFSNEVEAKVSKSDIEHWNALNDRYEHSIPISVIENHQKTYEKYCQHKTEHEEACDLDAVRNKYQEFINLRYRLQKEDNQAERKKLIVLFGELEPQLVKMDCAQAKAWLKTLRNESND